MSEEKTGITYQGKDGEAKDVTFDDLRQLAVEQPVQEAVATEAKKRPPRPAFERRELFDALMLQSDTVRVLAVGSDLGVVLPPELSIPKLVAIHFGKGVPKPPKDVSSDEWGVRATVFFSSGEHLAAIPWDAVVQVTDMDKMVWQDSRRMNEFSERASNEKLPPKHTKRGKAARQGSAAAPARGALA